MPIYEWKVAAVGRKKGEHEHLYENDATTQAWLAENWIVKTKHKKAPPKDKAIHRPLTTKSLEGGDDE